MSASQASLWNSDAGKGVPSAKRGLPSSFVDEVVVGHQQQCGALGLLCAALGALSSDELLQCVGPAVPV